MNSKIDKTEKVMKDSSVLKSLIIKKEILKPKQIWLLNCHESKARKFAKYVSKICGFSCPKEGFMKPLKGGKIIHVTDTFYILINCGSGFNISSIKELSEFGSIQDLKASFRILRITGKDSARVLNRLVGIDAEEMKNGQCHSVPISSNTGYLNKINSTSFELIVPSSYSTYFELAIRAVVLGLENLGQSEIQLDYFLSKLRA